MKTGPTALTRQTIERPLKAIGNIAKKIRGKGQLYSKK